jgi:ferredoxin--NADP+ reductase
VTAIKLVRNELYQTPTGTLQPRATEQFETLPVQLVFRSVGYRGVPLPGVPFNDKWGVILNEMGRVIDPNRKHAVVGEYTAGWIKRGPSGVIGTNKPDAAETVACMLEDLARGAILQPAAPSAAAADALVRSRQPQCLSYDDWRYLDQLEVERGRALGRPRVKLTRLDEILTTLRERHGAGNR